MDEIVDGVLESEVLSKKIPSDYDFNIVNGPIDYIGQDQFINMYVYKDSSEVLVYYFRQIIYQKPNSSMKMLINDTSDSTKMSTFHNGGQILVSYGNKFQNFTSGGIPLDEIEFEGHSTKF